MGYGPPATSLTTSYNGKIAICFMLGTIFELGLGIGVETAKLKIRLTCAWPAAQILLITILIARAARTAKQNAEVHKSIKRAFQKADRRWQACECVTIPHHSTLYCSMKCLCIVYSGMNEPPNIITLWSPISESND